MEFWALDGALGAGLLIVQNGVKITQHAKLSIQG